MSENSAVVTSQNMAKALEVKAKHNKRESLWSFKLIMILTLLTPILINITDSWLWGKLIPSSFAAIASFLTAWLKLRKPESLWSLYRTGQRQIEKEIRYYEHKITPYHESSAEQILIENVSVIYDKTHDGWLKLIPSSENMKTSNNEK